MPDKRKLFLKILKVELEEVENDIDLLMQVYKARYDKQEITSYVLRENDALLELEISCVKKLVPALDTFSAEEYQDEEAFITGLKAFLERFVEENQFPHAVFLLAEQRLQKVVKYIY